MDPKTLDTLAERLRTASDTGTSCAPLVKDYPDLTIDDAYRVQHANVARRITSGARLVGRKVGLTNFAVQKQLGISEPDFGHLFDDMSIKDGGTFDLSRTHNPRAEAEVAFVLGDGLAGPGVTAADVWSATAYVLPAIEIIDSRVADWDITIVDTVADNASSLAFVLGGAPVGPDAVDWSVAGMALRKNGRVASTGAGAASLGHPVNAVVWLANRLGAAGESLRAGDIVLSGALGPVIPVVPGDVVDADIAHLGRVSVRFTGEGAV